eukprot:CAMPEP_0195524996 /NCGR_PEP_ID=MMETSP0794_2-20130614/25173_1 /TAXON_ID=515487 /ORGANISM="Stephanopyxis turris, Strain CCMP 815" /LENGTH=192 /DNA_ID=CAMNT_0040655347 /DNA_START=73 /DNA_END=648 /DNA_ORIENTATION=-
MANMLSTILLAVVAVSCFTGSEAIGVQVRRRTERCVFEEIGQNLLVVGEYTSEKPVDVRVTDKNMKTILKESSDGGLDKFAFTSTEEGLYGVCFTSSQGQEVFVDIAAGVDAKDYSDIVKREHLEPVELTMLHVEEEVQSLLTHLIHQREHEMVMAQITFSTVNRVYYLSIFVILVIAGVGAWEARHMKGFL